MTKTKQITIEAGHLTDVIASHLFAVGAIPKGWDVTEISSIIKKFGKKHNSFTFDITLEKEDTE